MDIAQWWHRVDPQDQDWLIEHNGEPLPPPMLDAITAAGADDRWLGTIEPGGICLTDDAVDWIEGTANGETPG